MERYTWRDGKIRLRLQEAELQELGLDRGALLRFDKEARRALRALLFSLKEKGVLPEGELLTEVFPGRRGAVLQITPAGTKAAFFLPRTDDMLAVFPLAKRRGAALFRRLDGKGYYVTCADEKTAAVLGEFAGSCRVPDGVLKENCRRIL